MTINTNTQLSSIERHNNLNTASREGLAVNINAGDCNQMASLCQSIDYVFHALQGLDGYKTMPQAVRKGLQSAMAHIKDCQERATELQDRIDARMEVQLQALKAEQDAQLAKDIDELADQMDKGQDPEFVAGGHYVTPQKKGGWLAYQVGTCERCGCYTQEANAIQAMGKRDGKTLERQGYKAHPGPIPPEVVYDEVDHICVCEDCCH